MQSSIKGVSGVTMHKTNVFRACFALFTLGLKSWTGELLILLLMNALYRVSARQLCNAIPVTHCLRKALRELRVRPPLVQLCGAVLLQPEDPEE